MALQGSEETGLGSVPTAAGQQGGGGGGGSVNSVNAGVGIAVTGPATDPIVSNTGTLDVSAGAGIGVAGGPAHPTVSNTGVLAVSAGAGIAITGPQSNRAIANAGVTSVNGDVGAVTIGSSDGSINVQGIGGTDVDLTVAGGAGFPLSVASVKTTSATARKTILLSGDSLMAGNGGFQFSIMYWLVGGASGIPATQQPGGFINTWQVRGGEKILTPANTAVGGTTTADALTNVNAWLITPAPDGSDVLCNWGINDVIISGLSPAASAANVTAILTAFFAARPNSRLHWISAMWGGAEQWGLDSTGQPTGINLHDPAIRATNAAIKAAVVAFPNARYLDVYTDMYRAAALNNLPAPGLSTGFWTADGVHPGGSGANLMAQNIFARLTVAGGLFTKPSLPPSQSDMTPGHWYDECRAFMQTGIIGQKGAPLLSFNRYEQVRVSKGLADLPADLGDATTEGGGLNFFTTAVSVPPVHTFTSPIFQTPKTKAWAVAIDCQFGQPDGAGTCFVGLADINTNPGDGLYFGHDPAVSAGFFILRETKGGVNVDTILNGAGGVTAIPFDLNRHCAMLFYDGGAGAGGAGIWDCYVDFQQAAHLNPSARFPQNPVGLAAGMCSNGAFATVCKALYMYNEPFTTPA